MDNVNTAEITSTTEVNKLPNFNRNKWLFSVGGIGRDMSYQLVAAFLLVYVQFSISLSLAQFTTLSLIIGVGGRLWDAINDPMMGAIIEGTHMKWGKFKPWILIGSITCGIVIILMFNLRIWTGWGFVAFMTVAYLLWESTFTMNDIGYWAMLPSLSSKREERNSVTMLTVVFAGVGAFLAQGLVILLTPGNVVKGYSYLSLIIAFCFIGFQIMTSVGVKETPRGLIEKEATISLKHMWNTIRRNDQVLWMTLSMLFYNIASGLLVALAYNLYYIEVGYDSNCFYFIVVFGVINIACNAFYPKLSQKIGRKQLQKYSALIAILGYIGIAFLGWWPNVLPFNIITLIVFGILVFSGQTIFYMASIINITNCVEYNDYKSGERNEAVVSTLRPFMAKFASAVQYGIVTLVLAVSGIYMLSQNISTMEAQKDYLSDIKSSSEQVYYIGQIDEYLNYYDTLETEEEALNSINQALSSESKMTKYQLRPEYIKALGDCKLFREEYVNGTLSKKVDLGFWRDVEEEDLILDNGEKTYKYSMELTGEDFNAANVNFKNNSNVGMRLWLRTAVTVVPIILLFLALMVQNKKFIIDEKYYDMMLKEIEKRDQAKE